MTQAVVHGYECNVDIRVIKSQWIRAVGHVARMLEKRIRNSIVVGKP